MSEKDLVHMPHPIMASLVACGLHVSDDTKQSLIFTELTCAACRGAMSRISSIQEFGSDAPQFSSHDPDAIGSGTHEVLDPAFDSGAADVITNLTAHEPTVTTDEADDNDDSFFLAPGDPEHEDDPVEIDDTRERFTGREGYESLVDVLYAAYEHAANGKGYNRHDDGQGFEKQHSMAIADMLDSDNGLLQQAMKKILESQRLGNSMAIAELLGAINYLAMVVIRKKRKPNAERPIYITPDFEKSVRQSFHDLRNEFSEIKYTLRSKK